jgi:prepilin-type N-terminal cleavage/methylation domain-containing protein
MQLKNKEDGFTLVEIIVSIVVIGIVVTTVTGLMLLIQSTQRRTSYMETATRSAQLQMESLRNNNYNNLVVGENVDFTNQLPTSLKNKSGTVIVSEPYTGLKRVDISVVYSEGSTQQEVKLSSLVGILGITQ